MEDEYLIKPPPTSVVSQRLILRLKQLSVTPSGASVTDLSITASLSALAPSTSITAASSSSSSLLLTPAALSSSSVENKLNFYISTCILEGEKHGFDLQTQIHKKLPNQERLSYVGEMELIVNFLDPILSPICHCPDIDKLLIWLNRQDENTLMLKPDAVMMATPQNTTDITLGYCSVRELRM
ncbi:hypothetical protein INT45_000427 [Circinella minor]|uniref:Uncharacterized protein n=1 Tax=Circinella minor TaxID=1195481 RepID=A0A8H7RUP5_9FUNG|nr:hypothetical protein INT45_000427 [Circinella minor]